MMNFNIKDICSIYESEGSPVKDEIGANMDRTMGNTDLMDIYDNVCPISGEVFAAMKKSAADPKNLKITVSSNGNGENAMFSELFIEAAEFMLFCEAGEVTIKGAIDKIIEAYEEEIPGIKASDINIVFPSDALNKNTIGSEHRGFEVKDEWPMQLMKGCRRYGMTPRVGIKKN